MEEKKFWFETIKQDERTGARAGVFHTPHGDIETPVYMPVGTQATVKGVLPRDLKEVGAQIILANTYHLYMRPGDELVKAAGGLHKFMNWDRPILTDSGGFQVFSLAKLNKIKDEGVYFNSHVDGRLHFITPEKAIAIENNLGADIIMAFDQCSEYGADYKFSKAAMERTLKWLERCAAAHKNENQALFPIVQGNMFKDLREISLKESIPYAKHGIAIGGLSVGEPKEIMYDIMDFMLGKYPADVPRYLMGVGTPVNILEGVYRGVDLFDCVMPSRNARHGHLFTWEGIINIQNAKYVTDDRPVDALCGCPLCRNHTRAYLRHLMRANEMLGMRLAVMHNLWFYNTLMEEIRLALDEGRFESFYREHVPILGKRI